MRMTQRLSGLEAMRGLAAILVAWNHAVFLQFDPALDGWALPYSYLAVDLFFLLSGFVLSRAFEGRMPGAAAFAMMRFKRLWLPVACGTGLGAIYYVLAGMGVLVWSVHLAAGLAILPLLGFAFLFNAPAWSIFFELFANFAHALTLNRVGDRALGVMVAACGLVLLLSGTEHGMDVGQGDKFWMGFVRVLFSYGIGILVYRLNGDRTWTSPHVAWPILGAYCLAIALYPDVLGGQAEVLFIAILHPAILLCVLSLQDNRLATILGAYSFPLYAIHYPVQMLATGAAMPWWNTLAVSMAVSAVAGLAIDRRFRAAFQPGPWPGRRLSEQAARRSGSEPPTSSLLDGGDGGGNGGVLVERRGIDDESVVRGD